MVKTNFLVILLMTLPFVIMSPVRKEEETPEKCRGNYCAMFDGICQNGGTCISKGCKGECKCTSEYSGHNCEIPNMPLTTKAPEPKRDKLEEESRKKDFSNILSLFRILSGPRNSPDVTNHVSKEKSKDKTKDSDKHSKSMEKKRRENFPSRSEQATEGKSEKTSENENNSSKDKRTTESQSFKPSQLQTTVSPIKIGTKSLMNRLSKATRNMNTSFENPSSNQTKMKKNFTDFPLTKATKIPKLSSKATVKSVEKVVMEKNKAISQNTDKTIFASSAVFSGNRELPTPQTFHAPRNKWNSSKKNKIFDVKNSQLSVNADRHNNQSSEDVKKTTSSDLSGISNVGLNVLSSTTLSNLYLSHSFLSKSRIFVSTMPNKVMSSKAKQLSTGSVSKTKKGSLFSKSQNTDEGKVKNSENNQQISLRDTHLLIGKNLSPKDKSKFLIDTTVSTSSVSEKLTSKANQDISQSTTHSTIRDSSTIATTNVIDIVETSSDTRQELQAVIKTTIPPSLSKDSAKYSEHKSNQKKRLHLSERKTAITDINNNKHKIRQSS